MELFRVMIKVVFLNKNMGFKRLLSSINNPPCVKKFWTASIIILDGVLFIDVSWWITE
jgi:hypothetical protein